MACSLSIKQIKIVRLRSKCSFFVPIHVVEIVATELQIGQLQREVGILAVLKLATEVILEQLLSKK